MDNKTTEECQHENRVRIKSSTKKYWITHTIKCQDCKAKWHVKEHVTK